MQLKNPVLFKAQEPLPSRRFEDRIFNAIYDRSLLYNTCWEDPAVDQQALSIDKDDHMVVITSAGCNVLDYALSEPAKIHAVDANPRQTALLELKLAAIRALPFETFFELFGEGRCRDFRRIYAEQLRPLLSPLSQYLWNRSQHYFDPIGKGCGFYYRGLSGLVARLFRHYLALRPRLRRGIHSMMAVSDMRQQCEVFHDEVEPYLMTLPIRWILDRQVTMNLLGVPAAQRQEVERESRGSVSDFVQSAIRRVCTQVPFSSNYFWMVYLRGSYAPGCVPRYLEPEGFAALKGGLIDCIVPHTSTLTRLLAARPDREINRFVLLDHMDWMAGNDPRGLSDEWNEILRTARSDTIIIFRSGAADPTYLHQIPVATDKHRGALADVLVYDVEKARRLHLEDRVGTYAGFHIAHLA